MSVCLFGYREALRQTAGYWEIKGMTRGLSKFTSKARAKRRAKGMNKKIRRSAPIIFD